MIMSYQQKILKLNKLKNKNLNLFLLQKEINYTIINTLFKIKICLVKMLDLDKLIKKEIKNI